MRRSIRASAFLLALCALGESARADFVVTIVPESPTIFGASAVQGSNSITVDVFIRYVPGTSTVTTLDNFSYGLVFTPISTPGHTTQGQLQFATDGQGGTPETFGMLQNTPNYVYASNSGNHDLYLNGLQQSDAAGTVSPSSPPIGTPSGTYQNNLLVGGDYANDPSINGPINTNPNANANGLLLTRFQVVGNSSLASLDSFQLSLLAQDTSFNDSNFNPQPYTSNSVTFTIAGSASVPVPASIVLLGSGFGLATIRRSFRGRRPA